METNPYQSPEHYSAVPQSAIPWTAYVAVAISVILGCALAYFGFNHLTPGIGLLGLLFAVAGFVGAFYLVTYRVRSK